MHTDQSTMHSNVYNNCPYDHCNNKPTKFFSKNTNRKNKSQNIFGQIFLETDVIKDVDGDDDRNNGKFRNNEYSNDDNYNHHNTKTDYKSYNGVEKNSFLNSPKPLNLNNTVDFCGLNSYCSHDGVKAECVCKPGWQGEKCSTRESNCNIKHCKSYSTFF